MNLDITERKQAEEKVALLAKEAEHRAKNLLAIVQAAVRLTQSETSAGFKEAIEGRIQALANVHGLLVRSHWQGAELRSLVTQEFTPYCHDGMLRVQIDGPDVLLEPDLAQAIAVTLHELGTNAAKYGALSLTGGKVKIDWSPTADGGLVIRWSETGGPTVKPPQRNGFGTRAMETMIRSHLNGKMHCEWRAEGLVCEIALPASLPSAASQPANS
jgi:two-component sensor histidine kinase